MATPTYRYSLPVTFTGTINSGDWLRCTIPDWADITANLRARSDGNDVRVFYGASELNRDFSSGVLTFQAPENNAAAYTVKFGKKDAGSPTTAGYQGLVDPTFDVDYTADALPQDATPAWTRSADTAPTIESSSGGELHIKTGNTNYVFYYIVESSGYAAHVYGKMRAKVATHQGTDGVPYIQFLAKSNSAARMGPISDTSVSCGYHNGTAWVVNPVTVASLGSGYHTYAIAWNDTAGTLTYYLDDIPIATYSGPHYTASGTTNVYFGDGSSANTGTTPEFYIDRVSYADELPVTYNSNATFGLRYINDTSTTLRQEDNYVSGGDTYQGLYGATLSTGVEWAQCFQLTNSDNIAKIRLKLKNETDTRPDDTDYSEWVTVRVESDSSGVPSGTVLAEMRVPFAVIKKSAAGYGWTSVWNRSNFAGTAETDYWLILSVPKNTNANMVLWEMDETSPSFTRGVSTRTRSSSSWGSWGAKDTSKSFLFEVYSGFTGAPTLPDVSIASDQTPYMLPASFPAWADQTPPVGGAAGMHIENGKTYFSNWAVDDSTYEDGGISSYVIEDDAGSITVSSTKMLDGYVNGSTLDEQRRCMALWKDGSTYKGIATFFVYNNGARHLHYVHSDTLMNTTFTDGGAVSMDICPPYDDKFAIKVIDGAQDYLYFDVSPNATLYNDLEGIKPVRAKYNGTSGLTDFDYIEFDFDGINENDAQIFDSLIFKSADVGWIALVFVQWYKDAWVTGTIYYTKSNDGVVWSPAKELFTLGPEGTLTATSAAGASTVTVSTADAAKFAANDYIEIQGNNPNERLQSELKKISSINGGTGVITLTEVLSYAHNSGRKIGRYDSNQAIIYGANLTDSENAIFYGHVAASTPWIASGGGSTFWRHLPIRWTGDLSALLIVPPNAVTNLTVTPSGPTQIDISWTDNATDETSYLIDRSVDGGEYLSLNTLDPDTESYSDLTVSQDHVYRYRVTPYNGNTNWVESASVAWVVGSGGAVAGGSSLITAAFNFVSSGGAVAGGEAVISFGAILSYAIVGSGGGVCGGAADFSGTIGRSVTAPDSILILPQGKPGVKVDDTTYIMA